MLFLTAVGAISGLTFILATALVLANRKLYVYEDPRIDVVEEMLPHANCGACGFPGCRPFAEALTTGEALPGKCTVSSGEERAEIASFLGVDVGAEEKIVARLACAGGTNVARNHARYHGHQTCRSAARDAIHMNAHNLPVVDEAKCTACGDCVEVCPKDLFSLHKESHRLWVVCSSQEAGDEILEDCEVACTTCGRCEMDAPAGLITMKKNLPVVDYSRPHKTQAPIERCPTGAIVWIDPKAGPVKGPAAKKIIRKGTLRDAPT
jgi:RnfABCDGE-type electron transport complex B subunit